MNDPGKDPLNLIFCSSYPFLRGGKNESACHYMYIRSKFRSDKAGSWKFELLYPKKKSFCEKIICKMAWELYELLALRLFHFPPIWIASAEFFLHYFFYLEKWVHMPTIFNKIIVHDIKFAVVLAVVLLAFAGCVFFGSSRITSV